MQPALSFSSNDSGFEEVSFARDTKKEKTVVFPPAAALIASEQLPAIPLSGFTHSLVPDMVFGWRPKNLHGGPIPLLFNKRELPVARDPVTQEECMTVFNGFRPRDSMAMHRAFATADGYPVPSIPALDVYEFLHRRDPRLREAREFVGMNPACGSEEPVFDSEFECGNLDKAVKLADGEYDLYMRADANTRGFHQWYFFSVEVSDAQEIRFHMLNFTKNESLYSQGMLPVVFSECDGRGWHRDGFDVDYRVSKLSQSVSDRKGYFALSFSYRFRRQEKAYFAYAVPYSYSQLCRFLMEAVAKSQRIAQRDVLCKSLSGVEVPLLTICSADNPRKDFAIVTGRVHPGETHGSWMAEGLIRFLLSDAASVLRSKVVFLVVPCLNPDGVIMGNYRTGFSGQDLNRQFESPDSLLHPSIFFLKKLIAKTRNDGQLLAYIDLHAHSKKKSVFIYGPHFPLHSEKYYSVRVLPKILCDQGPEFRFSACRFKNEVSKQKAARLAIWRQFGIANSYTVEGSFHGFLAENRTTVAFTEETLIGVGKKIGEGVWEYVQMMEAEAKVLEEKRKARKKRYGKLTKESPPQSPAKCDFASPLDAVITSIKEAEEIPADSNSTSSSDCAEDQLLLDDQLDLHEEITHIVDEFSSLATQTKRPLTKLAKYHGKAGRITPEMATGRDYDRDFSRSTSIRLRKRDLPKATFAEGKTSGSPFFAMTEVKSTRSIAGCRRKVAARDTDATRTQSKSPLVDTRRIVCYRLRKDGHLRSISPVPNQKSACEEEEAGESAVVQSLGSAQRQPQKSDPRLPRHRVPVARPVSILPHVPAPKSRPLLTISRKLSQIFAKAKVLSSECG